MNGLVRHSQGLNEQVDDSGATEEDCGRQRGFQQVVPHEEEHGLSPCASAGG